MPTKKVSILTPPPLRAYWPEQGGRYMGIMRGEGKKAPYHLILPIGLPEIRGPWSDEYKTVTGTNHRFDGLTNTKAMAKVGSRIAKEILALEHEGHSDLYLMSQGEAALCSANGHDFFETGWHWTSTQYSSGYAWYQLFHYGYQSLSGKKFEARARAVRRLILQSFDSSVKA